MFASVKSQFDFVVCDAVFTVNSAAVRVMDVKRCTAPRWRQIRVRDMRWLGLEENVSNSPRLSLTFLIVNSPDNTTPGWLGLQGFITADVDYVTFN